MGCIAGTPSDSHEWSRRVFPGIEPYAPCACYNVAWKRTTFWSLFLWSSPCLIRIASTQKACKHAKIAIWQRTLWTLIGGSNKHSSLNVSYFPVLWVSNNQPTPSGSFKFWTAGFSGSWFGFLHHCCSNFGERKYVKGGFLPPNKLPERSKTMKTWFNFSY